MSKARLFKFSEEHIRLSNSNITTEAANIVEGFQNQIRLGIILLQNRKCDINNHDFNINKKIENLSVYSEKILQHFYNILYKHLYALKISAVLSELKSIKVYLICINSVDKSTKFPDLIKWVDKKINFLGAPLKLNSDAPSAPRLN